MNLTDARKAKIPRKKKFPVGRGHSSGLGKQCGRGRLPVIDPARPLASILAEPPDAAVLRLCFWEEERTPLAEVVASLPAPPAGAMVIVGPEGGLTREEVGAARRAGWEVAGFGPRLLRTETAGPAIVAALQFEFGDLG